VVAVDITVIKSDQSIKQLYSLALPDFFYFYYRESYIAYDLSLCHTS
jgi:hypothetical protein